MASFPVQSMRMRSIFDPVQQGPMPPYQSLFQQPLEEPPPEMIPPVVPQTAVPDVYDPGKRMQELYTPETAASDRYTGLINNQPQYNEHQGKLKSLAAAIVAGLGGAKAGTDVLTSKYRQDLGTWKTDVGNAEKAATLEKGNNAVERQLANSTVQSELAGRKQTDTVANNTEKNRLAAERLKLNTYKAEHPDLDFDFSGPNVLMSNPRTGEVYNTGVKTGSMSDVDKLELTQKNALEKIHATGGENRKTEEVRQDGRETLQDSRAWVLGTIPDPNDPAKQIGVQINQITGQVRPVSLGGQNTPIAKVPSKLETPVDPKLQGIQEKTREILSLIDNEILDGKPEDTKRNLRPEVQDAVGASRWMGLQFLPATQTRKGDAAVQRLKSNQIIQLISEMKAQSKTGATGFGQLNIKELNVLESAASKLDPSLDEDTFLGEVMRIRERLAKILQPANGVESTSTTKPQVPLDTPPVAPPGWKYVKTGVGWTAVEDKK